MIQNSHLLTIQDKAVIEQTLRKNSPKTNHMYLLESVL